MHFKGCFNLRYSQIRVVIKSVELYNLVKTGFWFFWFCSSFCHLRPSGNWFAGVASRSRRTKPITKQGLRALWLVYPSASASDSDNLVFTRSWAEYKQQSHKQSRRKMETFWFFWLWFHRDYDSTYNSNFWFSLDRKCSYNFAYDSDSVASEQQP